MSYRGLSAVRPAGLGALPSPSELKERMTTAESIGLAAGLAAAALGQIVASPVLIGVGTSLAAQGLFSALSRVAGWKKS